MRIVPAAIFVAALASTLAVAAHADVAPTPPSTSNSSVTLPLDHYTALQKANESANVTVVDTMTLDGTFQRHDLTVTLTGRSVGTRTATPVISDAPDVTLSRCSGDALLVHAGKGTYHLVALAPSFTLRCDARPSGSDRLQMTVAPAVLAVGASVGDGELVAGDEDDSGTRQFTLVRQVVGANETLATTATGHYLIVLLPDTTRFRYVIQVHNPNRSTSPMPLRLVSGEHLQQIDSSAPYEPKDGSYVFAVPPGDATITLTGELQGTSFAPPVEASLQYLMLESHPLLRPTMLSRAKRISAAESGMTTQYRGALAFEIGPHERLTWSVTRLQALRAISYAVHDANHTLFIPADGPVLGESTLALDNQGAPELLLGDKPEPTYVSLAGEPVLMTKNAAGGLTIPLSAGVQQLMVQHRQPIAQFPLLFATLAVPRLAVPATYTTVQLRYPEHWLPLWQSFATRAKLWHPDMPSLLAFLLLALWLERLLAFLKMTPRARAAAALLLSFAAMVISTLLWLLIVAASILTLLWLASQRPKVSGARIAMLAAAGLFAITVAVVYVIDMRMSSNVGYSNISSSGSGGLARVNGAAAETGVTETAATDSVAPKAPAQLAAGVPVNAPQEREADAYAGLPAKFELPSGATTSVFNEQLLAADRPQTVTLVLLSMTVVTWLGAALAAIAALLLLRERETVAAALRLRMDEAMAQPVAAAG